MKRFVDALLRPFDGNPARRQGALLLYVASTYPMVILVGITLSFVGLDWVSSILALPFLFVYGPAMGLALIAGIFSFPRGGGLAGIYGRSETARVGDTSATTAPPPALGIIPRAMWTVAVVACLSVIVLMFLSYFNVAWGVFVFGFFPVFTILGATGATMAAIHVRRATTGT